jgi:hypothetical protein
MVMSAARTADPELGLTHVCAPRAFVQAASSPNADCNDLSLLCSREARQNRASYSGCRIAGHDPDENPHDDAQHLDSAARALAQRRCDCRDSSRSARPVRCSVWLATAGRDAGINSTKTKTPDLLYRSSSHLRGARHLRSLAGTRSNGRDPVRAARGHRSRPDANDPPRALSANSPEAASNGDPTTLGKVR